MLYSIILKVCSFLCACFSSSVKLLLEKYFMSHRQITKMHNDQFRQLLIALLKLLFCYKL